MGAETDDTATGVYLLGGLASVDVVARAVPDVVAAADATILPVGLRLGTDAAAGYDAVGWAIGWLLLWTAVFAAVPAAFPRQLLVWANGVAARVGLATAAVTVGLYLEAGAWLVVTRVGDVARGPTWFPVPVWTFPAALLVLAAVFWLTRVMPVRHPGLGSGLIPYTGLTQTDDGSVTVEAHRVVYDGEIDGDRLLSRWLLLVVLAGLLLSVVALLYPLPEVVFLALAGRELTRRVVGSASTGPAYKDIAERYVRSLGAIWVGPRGVLGVVYAVVAVPAMLYLDFTYLTVLGNREAVVASPLALGFLVATLGVATVGVTAASVRLAERLTAEFVDRDDEEGITATDLDDLDDRLPRVPGYMLLPAALVVLYESVRSHPPTDPPYPYTLTVEPVEFLVAVVLAGACLFTLRYPRGVPFPGRSVRTYYAAPLSSALFISTTASYLIGTSGLAVSTGVPPPAVPTLEFTHRSVVVVLSPLVGYELFRTDPDDHPTPTARLRAETKVAFGWFLAAVGTGAVALAGLGALGNYVLGEAVLITLYVPPMYGVITRLVLLGFYGIENVVG